MLKLLSQTQPISTIINVMLITSYKFFELIKRKPFSQNQVFGQFVPGICYIDFLCQLCLFGMSCALGKSQIGYSYKLPNSPLALFKHLNLLLRHRLFMKTVEYFIHRNTLHL